MSLETINATFLDLNPEDLLLDLGSGEGRHTISFGLSQTDYRRGSRFIAYRLKDRD